MVWSQEGRGGGENRENILSSLQVQGGAGFPSVVSTEASAFALFGRQCTNEVYFDDLQYLSDVYNPFIASFVQTATTDVLVLLAEKVRNSSFYTFGIDVISWLSGAVLRPDVSYLASVPVSFPPIPPRLSCCKFHSGRTSRSSRWCDGSLARNRLRGGYLHTQSDAFRHRFGPERSRSAYH